METMTDYEEYSLGIKDQNETWWGEAIEEKADRVRSGEYGEVIDEYEDSDGWMDGVPKPHFVVRHPEHGLIDVRADESTVMYDVGCGWVKLQPVE